MIIMEPHPIPSYTFSIDPSQQQEKIVNGPQTSHGHVKNEQEMLFANNTSCLSSVSTTVPLLVCQGNQEEEGGHGGEGKNEEEGNSRPEDKQETCLETEFPDFDNPNGCSLLESTADNFEQQSFLYGQDDINMNADQLQAVINECKSMTVFKMQFLCLECVTVER